MHWVSGNRRGRRRWKEYEENLNKMKMRVRKLGDRELVNEMKESGLKEGMEDKLVCRWAMVVRMGRVRVRLSV